MVRGRGIVQGARGQAAGGRGGGGRRGNRGAGRRGRGFARRGRRGRGYGRGGGSSHSGGRRNSGEQAEQDMAICTSFSKDMPFDQKVRSILVGKGEFAQHLECQNENPTRYSAVLISLVRRGVTFAQVSKNRALAAAWARKDYKLSELMLSLPGEIFFVTEVLKALSALDAGRMRRAVEKTMKRLDSQGCKKKKKLAQLRSLFGSLEKEVVEVRSTTGALIRHIKKWTKSIPKHRLEFYALHFPAEPWKKLADICHLNPEKDFPQCTWFLPYCFGKEAPSGTVVGDVGVLTEENLSQMVKDHCIDYTVIRNISQNLTDEMKTKITGYTEELDTVIWYYEELKCAAVDEIIKCRAGKGETLKMSYGKLMERLMMFRAQGNKSLLDLFLPVAEQRLKSTSLNLESPVAVIGDMSGSMNIAIRTSNIIASLLAAICDADLVFFDNELVHPDFIPKTVEEVIQLSDIIQARGGTTPAIGLSEYYENKKVVRTFVIVTDEGENGDYDGQRFSELFMKYYKEVYPSRLIFISFMYNQTDPGQMVTDLHNVFPEFRPLQFRFDYQRPDLSKLDNVFGLLSTQTEMFKSEVDEVEKELSMDTIAKTMNGMKC